MLTVLFVLVWDATFAGEDETRDGQRQSWLFFQSDSFRLLTNF